MSSESGTPNDDIDEKLCRNCGMINHALLARLAAEKARAEAAENAAERASDLLFDLWDGSPDLLKRYESVRAEIYALNAQRGETAEAKP